MEARTRMGYSEGDMGSGLSLNRFWGCAQMHVLKDWINNEKKRMAPGFLGSSTGRSCCHLLRQGRLQTLARRY